MIVAWSTQRILWLHSVNPEFNPDTFLYSIPAASRKETVEDLMALPLVWATMGKEFTVLNPMMWEASGASIEYPATGGVTIQFPDP